jgi:16S rRNA (cytosine967-C5)-methyltransferase
VRLEVERGRRLDRAFADVAAGAEPRERAFAHELAYGTTRLRGRIDHLLSLRLHGPIDELQPEVREILRLGTYQLLYMGGVPAYAAVSESVDLVRRKVGGRPAGLVNAVLRQVGPAGDGPEHFPPFETDPLGFLESWGSHPRWLLERWLARWDADTVRALVEANNRRPPTFIVPLELSPEGAVSTLVVAGLPATAVGGASPRVQLGEGVAPADALRALPKSIVQDAASNLVARYADVPEGTKVADLCSAPGGKTLAVADRALYTLAADRSESRLLMVKENARRVGRPLGLVVADARRPPLSRVDVVLLDAPCSGTGTFARRPDARWRLQPEDVGELVSVQREMLDAAADVVAEGGVLVYATCSLEPEENQEQIEALLARRPDFALEPTAAVPSEHLDAKGRLFVTPWQTGSDGAFAARLRRAA